ncbi:ribonuclease H family protein [Bacillus testis]|uniref:ribonuclease H family protein n=1 Tax=Bacillus testis TaxID=1622072 RepID=UPI00067E9D75|nr:ribonuclease H family protein [Bacillus testis]
MKVSMSWTYRNKKKPSCDFQSDMMDAKQALIIADDLEKTGRAHSFYFIDNQQVSWSKKELSKLLEEIQEEPQEVEVYFDGGYMKDEKLAGLGIIIYYLQNDKRYRRRLNKRLSGLLSNNEAEYAAFYESICVLEDMGIHHQTCDFFGDSQVVLNQLAGEWPCFDPDLNGWLDRIEEKMAQLAIKPVYHHIGRKQNKGADGLAVQALEGTDVDSTLLL